MSGFSDKFDSSSDHKVIHCESKVSNNSAEEEEEEEEEGSLVGSKMRRNHTDEFSGSEPESSPLPRRSLSWKSGKDSSCSREKKYTDSSTRSRSTFASTTSASPRRRDGKCCRHIRRREARCFSTHCMNGVYHGYLFLHTDKYYNLVFGFSDQQVRSHKLTIACYLLKRVKLLLALTLSLRS
ncbi:unnamed protein product [Camellia sinensis]